MNASEIRRMTRIEVETQLDEAKRSLWNLRFRKVTQHLDNPATIRDQRREVARMNTLLREDALGIHALAASVAGGDTDDTEKTEE